MFVSPLDMFVTVAPGRTSGPVAKGAKILLLDTVDLDRHMARMETLRDMIDVLARKVDPKFVERYVAKPLREQRDLLRNGVEQLEAVAQQVKDRYNLGEVTSTDVATAMRDLAAARAAAFESDDTLRQKLADVARQRDLKAIAEERIVGEIEFLRAQITKRTVVAPDNGTLELLVGSTMFVEKGDVLASFVPA